MDWIAWVALVSLALGGGSAAVVVADEVWNRPKMMPVMYLVWPITMLWSGVLGLAAYWKLGRNAAAKDEGNPRWAGTGIAATHCGSGCTLGDIVAESGTALLSLSLLGHAIFAAWVIDYIAAFVLGIAFQYYTITPMRQLSPRQGLVAALKADTASLTAWQVGMYGWMAIVVFGIAGHELGKTDPVFWFAMQGAMLAGLLTSYPVNWWLLQRGIKEEM